MKIVAIIARLLLGLVFVVFGLNGFLQFMPAPPIPGLAGEYVDALLKSHYIYLVSGTQLIAGALLLVNRYVPLALALLAPVLANILVYHITMQPGTIGPGLVCTILWALLVWRLRAHFAPLFVARAVEAPAVVAAVAGAPPER